MRRSAFVATLFFALVPAFAADASPLEAHCWCRLTKGDAGPCNLRAVALDAGAIGKFQFYDRGKDAKCNAACDRVLADRSDGELCTGISRLGAPMPWNGQLRSCARVGASGDHAGAARAVACNAGSVAAPVPEGFWKLTFADEFKGVPEGASRNEQSCYNRKPACLEMYKSGAQECPGADRLANVAHLNKCTWTLLHKQNTWGPELGSFDTRLVEVRPNEDDGVLILTTRGMAPDQSFLPFDAERERNGKYESKVPYKKADKWRFKGQYDCTRTEWNQPARSRCPFASGALVSQRFGDAQSGLPTGFTQRYGRFELRAKLSYGAVPGPSAMWMLPQVGAWPGAGEIDIMEQDKDGNEPFQTFHTGSCSQDQKAALDASACKAAGGKQFHIMKSGSTKVRDLKGDRTPFWKGYHTYAVEWDANTVRFLIDDQVRNEIRSGEIKQGNEMDVQGGKKAERKFMPMWTPQTEFYFLFTQGPAELKKKILGLIPWDRMPNPDNFVPFEMRIDYLRAYQKCATPADFCASGDAFDAASATCRGRAGAYASPCAKKAYR